jgi:hypothetical protein
MVAGLCVDLDRWRREFGELMQRAAVRPGGEPRRRMAALVQGLLAGLPRSWTGDRPVPRRPSPGGHGVRDQARAGPSDDWPALDAETDVSETLDRVGYAFAMFILRMRPGGRLDPCQLPLGEGVHCLVSAWTDPFYLSSQASESRAEWRSG